MQLTKDQVNTILKNAPSGSNKTDILNGLINRGYDLEGVDSNAVKKMLTEQKPKQMTGYSDTGADIKQIGTDITTSAKEGITKIKEAANANLEGRQNPFTTAIQQVGVGLGAVSNIFGDIIKGAVKVALPNEAQKSLKGGVESVVTPIVQTDIAKGIIEKYNSLNENQKRSVDAVLGIGSFALDVTGAGLGGKAVKTTTKVGKEAIETGIKTGAEVLEEGARATAKIAEKLGTPKPTPIQAAKTILQGKTKDIKSGIKSLSVLDTTGVKTYNELGEKITQTISDLATKVDEDLATDATKKVLDDLVITSKSTAGNVVKVNPVERALNQLDELYTKIGDDVSAQNIKELLNTAKTQGLTNLEINDIAKVYGAEFGSKAFGKTGEALTSVNSQLYENTRKQLKTLARSGIKGNEAKLADETMSSLYNTKKLVDNNIEAVNKLQQKIKERGLLEKVGYNVAKYGDILTGGTLRGLVGGLLPRGVGNKIMNAIDIEKQLESNLKIIQEALKSGDDAEIIKIINKLK